MHVMNTLLHMNESSVKMPETSAIIILFRLKRSHVVYCSINNNSLFSTPWVFLTMFCSFHIDCKEEKRRKKKTLFRKKKYQKLQRLPVNLQQLEFYFTTQQQMRTNFSPIVFEK